jgi:hypothetical protein
MPETSCSLYVVLAEWNSLVSQLNTWNEKQLSGRTRCFVWRLECNYFMFKKKWIFSNNTSCKVHYIHILMLMQQISLIEMLIFHKSWYFGSWGKQSEVWSPPERLPRLFYVDKSGTSFLHVPCSINFFSYTHFTRMIWSS